MTKEQLQEVTCGLQQDGKLTKRWYNCQSADLFFWHDKNKLVRFEFCYNKHQNEHSLRWQHKTGFTHARVDDGENNGINKSSPILINEKRIDSDYIFTQFKEISDKVEFETRVFIMRKLLGIIVDY